MAGRQAERTEASLLDALAAPTVRLAKTRLRELRYSFLSPMLRDLLNRLRPIALGYSHGTLTWGEHQRIDALRIRRLRALKGNRGVDTRRTRRSVWDGFLHWVGQEALNRQTAERPPAEAVSTLVAGIAARFGYRRAKEYLAAAIGDPRKETPGVQHACALMAMRNAFEGLVDFEIAQWLIPQDGHRPTASRERARWAPALLALRACRDGEGKGAAVQITAAILSGLFRAEMGVGIDAIQPPLPGFGRNWPRDVGLDRPWPGGFRPPWPEGFSGPDPARVYALAGEQYGLSQRLLSIIFFDFRLSLALLYASSGNAITTRAALATVPPSPGVESALRAILDVLKASRASRSLIDAAWDTSCWDEAANRLYAKIMELPDPSVALGSPWWLVSGQYERQAAELFRQGGSGRRIVQALRRLRRSDLAAQLKPFWLLTENDEQSLLFTGRWLTDDRGHPADLDWRGLLEATCRDVFQEMR